MVAFSRTCRLCVRDGAFAMPTPPEFCFVHEGAQGRISSRCAVALSVRNLFPAWRAVVNRERNYTTPAIGSMRLGSLFLTLPTRALTGQQIMSSDGYGTSSALSCGAHPRRLKAAQPA